MMNICYNLFYGAKQRHVYQAYEQFWGERGYRLVEGKSQGYELIWRKQGYQLMRGMVKGPQDFVLYRSDGVWTVLDWCAGWEWKLRRQAQLYVSEAHQCPGLLVFVAGSYWGYELFSNGQAIDHFVQQPDESMVWFPGHDCRGKPELFVEQFPLLDLKATTLASYLVQQPSIKHMKRFREFEIAWDRLNVPPVGRGNQFNRFDRFAVLDFLRFVGLRIGNSIIPLAPSWRVFKIVDSNGRVFGGKEAI